MALAATVAAVCAGVFGVLFTLWSAPFPYDNLDRIRVATSVGGKAELLLDNVGANLHTLVAVKTPYLHNGVTQRYESMAIVALGLIVLLVAYVRRDRHTGAVAVTATLAVLLPLVLVVGLYDVAQGTRILGPHLLLSAALTVFAHRDRLPLALPAVLVAANLLALPWFHADVLSTTRMNYGDGYATLDRLQTFRRQLDGHLRYRPGAGRWCNTVLLATDHGFFYEIVAIPAGMGVSMDFSHGFDGPIRSGYVLATDGIRPLLPGRGARLVPITVTVEGTLYRNLDARCTEG
jgi:hypothetical protein